MGHAGARGSDADTVDAFLNQLADERLAIGFGESSRDTGPASWSAINI